MTYLWQFACCRVRAMSTRISWYWRMLHVNYFLFVTLYIVTSWIISWISRWAGSPMLIIFMRGGMMFGTVTCLGSTICGTMLESFFNFLLVHTTICKEFENKYDTPITSDIAYVIKLYLRRESNLIFFLTFWHGISRRSIFENFPSCWLACSWAASWSTEI